jgi:hypothetical protein
MQDGEKCPVYAIIPSDLTNIKNGYWTGYLQRIFSGYGTLIINNNNGELVTIGITNSVFSYDALSSKITDLIKVNEKSIDVEISANGSTLISCSAPSTGYKLVGFAMKSVTSWYPSTCLVWNDTQIAIFNLDNATRAFAATARCLWMKL